MVGLLDCLLAIKCFEFVCRVSYHFTSAVYPPYRFISHQGRTKKLFLSVKFSAWLERLSA
jgi:hypothetical protein